MNNAGMYQLVSFGEHLNGDDPFIAAIQKSTQDGSIFARALRSELEADLRVEEVKLKVLTQVNVYDSDGVMIASGSSSTADDALLFAALGYVREKTEANAA